MTEPVDFTGTITGRFVDDDNLRESGRVWVEFDNGGGQMNLPIDPEATNVKNAAIAEISASGVDAVQDVGVAQNSAVQDVHTARDNSVQSVNTAGDSAVGAVNTAKSDALTDIEAEVDRAEADRIQTGKDRVQTGLDRQATGADRVLTVDASAAAVVAAQIIANDDGWSRPPMIVPWWGVGIPVLAEIPHLQVGDIIERLSDGQRWRVEAS